MTLARHAALALAALAVPAAAETVAVDGHDVYYEVHGDLAAGTPVLVLHGGFMNVQNSFGELIPALSETRAVIGVEQQGHGHTPIHDGPMTLASMAADTLGVLDALKVPKAHVVGFSMGGMLGLELAVNHPDRLASLTAISASASGDGMLPDLIRMQREPGYQPPPEVAKLLPSEADFAEMAKGFADNPSGPEVWQQTMQKTGALLGGDWGWDEAQLQGVTAPVQLLIGDTDFILPDHALWMKQIIPGAWLGVLPDTTHMSILQHPALTGMLRTRIETAESGGQEGDRNGG